MVYLLLIPVLYAYQSVAARHIQRVNLNLYAVGGFTYLFSALIYAVPFALQPTPMQPLILRGGLALGVLYAATYLLFVPTLADRGVSVMAAMCQLSALLPMLASLTIWHEHPTPVRLSGALLCLIAMPMLGLDKGITDTQLTVRKGLIFAGMIVFNGGVLLTLKWFDEQHAGEQFTGFMLTTFIVATMVMALLWPAYQGRLNRGVLSWGAALSLCYAGASLMIVMALRTYEGAVVFPFAEATAVALTVAFAAFAWREIPGKVGLAGIAIVTVAAVLINL
jgi:drug/metabolite transporter (DMT)-like permease